MPLTQQQMENYLVLPHCSETVKFISKMPFQMWKDTWTLDTECSVGQGVYYTQTCIYMLLKVWKWYFWEESKAWPWFAAVRCKQELPLALPAQRGISALHPFPNLLEMGEVRGTFSAFGAVPLALTKVIWEREHPLLTQIPPTGDQAAKPRCGHPRVVPLGWPVVRPAMQLPRGQLPFPELLPEKQEPNCHVLVLQLLIMPRTRP